jgi:hypothetical protein
MPWRVSILLLYVVEALPLSFELASLATTKGYRRLEQIMRLVEDNDNIWRAVEAPSLRRREGHARSNGSRRTGRWGGSNRIESRGYVETQVSLSIGITIQKSLGISDAKPEVRDAVRRTAGNGQC